MRTSCWCSLALNVEENYLEKSNHEKTNPENKAWIIWSSRVILCLTVFFDGIHPLCRLKDHQHCISLRILSIARIDCSRFVPEGFCAGCNWNGIHSISIIVSNISKKTRRKITRYHIRSVQSVELTKQRFCCQHASPFPMVFDTNRLASSNASRTFSSILITVLW